MTLLCIPITAKTIKEAFSDISEAQKHEIDVIELRIDFISDINCDNLKKIIEHATKSVVVTCRNKKNGGHFSGTEEERKELFLHAVNCGVDYIDLEDDCTFLVELLSEKGQTKFIVSHHDFERTPTLKDLEKKYGEIDKLKPDFIKIVTTAKTINDNFVVFDLLKDKKNLTSFCMGLYGEISRVLAPKYGSYLTFASLGSGKESAPGQISIEEMNFYNIKQIDNDIQITGVIGSHAENSQSKYMHNANFKKSNLNFVYVPFKVNPEELNLFIDNFKKHSWRGLAVTVPHKEKIIELLDSQNESVAKIGACNTVLEENSTLAGSNTDYIGVIAALKEKIDPSSKRCLVIGAGGAARATVYALNFLTKSITVVNRTKEKAISLAEQFNVFADSMDNMKNLIEEHDIIINTTSVGMEPESGVSPIEKKYLVQGKIVMDIVYKPKETKLIADARDVGCEVITGERMLLHQATGQYALWTDKMPDINLMEQSLNSAIKRG